MAAGALDPILLLERGAHRLALRQQKREAHAAADDEGVALVHERVDDLDLVGDLRAAQDGDEGTLRLVEHAGERGDLALHEVTGIGGQKRRDAGRGGMGAVRGAEGVVDVGVGEVGQLAGRTRGRSSSRACRSGGSPAAAPRRPRRRRGLGLGVGSDGVGRETQQGGRAARRGAAAGRKRERLLEALARRTAEVAREDDAGAVADELVRWWAAPRGCGYRRVTTPSAHGHVEVDADEHASCRATSCRRRYQP